jgi:hypothetical protein
MTDSHDAEAQEDQNHEQEAWMSDQPPSDDFSDHGYEDPATSSEEESGMQADDAAGGERRVSKLVPIIAGVVGLLIVGFVGYWQFGRSPSSEVLPLPLSVEQTVDSRPVVLPIDKANTPLAESQNAVLPVISSAVSPKTALQEVPVQAGSVLPNKEADPAVTMPPVSVMNPPAVALPPKPTDSAVPTLVSPPSGGAVNPIVVDSVVDPKLNALSVRIDDLKHQLDHIASQLSQGTTMSSDVVVGAANISLENRLAEMEAQIKRIASGKTDSVAPADATSVIAVDGTDQEKPTKHPAVRKKATVKHQKTHTRKAKTHHIVHRESSPAHNTHWVLRAATPDDAWVAADASTSQLRHVRVGDALPGIGQINAIHQNGDSWVIEGSAGTIR